MIPIFKELVEIICGNLDMIKPQKKPYSSNIVFVEDRPGHDVRYALNSNKIKKRLGWKPRTSFKQGIKLTFEWYLRNKKYYKSLSKKDILKRLGNK